MKAPVLTIYTSNPDCPQAQAWAQQYAVRGYPVVLLPLQQLPQAVAALVRYSSPATKC